MFVLAQNLRFGNNDVAVIYRRLNLRKSEETFFGALAGDYRRDMVELFKRVIGVVETFFVAVIKNLIGQRLNRIVNAAESVIIVGIEIVFGLLFDNGMIGRNNFGGFVGRIGITFFLEITHDPGGGLIKAFIGQNAFLLFIAAVYYHFAK